MTARIDTLVTAAPPVAIAPEPALPAGVPPPIPPETVLARAEKKRELDAKIARWKAIEEAGGVEGWLRKELTAKGLFVDDSEKSDGKRYKERKRAEAEEKKNLERLASAAYRATHIVHLGAGVHWEDDPDKDKFDPADREERLRQSGLADLDANGLAAALEMPLSRLRWLCYHRDVDNGTHYRRWTIPKRDGTPRVITSPKHDLMAAQRWALRNVFERLPVHGAAHGFLAARSIASNARVHAGADVIVKLDIKDFFPTITWKRVKGLLRKSGLREGAATLLALLVTEAPRELVQFRNKSHWVAIGERALPQGSPTSPAVSNAIALRLDRRLSGLARALGFRYTRYADDLAFSWRRPSKARKDDHPKPPVGALLDGARQIVEAEGFRVHPEKTRVLRGGTRQAVTGLVVNKLPANSEAPTVRVPREVVRRLRAALHNREAGRAGKEGETLAELRGMAAFIHMVDPKRGKQFLARVDALDEK